MTKQIHRRSPTYADSSGERMTERLAVDGSGDPVLLTEVLAALEDASGGAVVHQAFFSWVRPATEKETQHYLDLQENQKQRTEKWERETLERLMEKYDVRYAT